MSSVHDLSQQLLLLLWQICIFAMCVHVVSVQEVVLIARCASFDIHRASLVPQLSGDSKVTNHFRVPCNCFSMHHCSNGSLTVDPLW